jgi:hypothetical protein
MGPSVRAATAANAQLPLMGSEATPSLLRELHIRLNLSDK